MPNYDFACIACDVTVERHFGFNDDKRVECENCGNRMTQVFSATPAHFKGGGWGGQ